MKEFLKTDDLMEILDCSRQTANRCIHQMEYLQKPLRVRKATFEKWVRDHTVKPPEVVRREMMLEKLRRANEKGGQKRGQQGRIYAG